MTLIERRTKAIARVLYMIDGADFDLIVRERADGPTATLVARKIAEALPDDDRGAVDPSEIVAWLRGRTGYGGGFTSADDVADAIERKFITERGQ